MRVSLSWLRELIDLPETDEAIAARLTLAGLEVEARTLAGSHLSGVVVGEVLASRPHPRRPELTLVDVGDGGTKAEVVCGAPNLPAPGGRVAFAPIGAKVKSATVEQRTLGGVESHGVLCSETDLELGVDGSGLLLLPADARPGTDLAEVLGLRDVLFDLNVTPNRPDWLGHLGVARELGALFRRPVRLPAPPAAARRPEPPAAPVTVEDPAGCPRYTAQAVRGVTVAPSPWAWRYRLHLLGVRAVSNLVDVTNLVLLLFGQPLHAFDLRRLRGPAIVVRRARPGESLETLDGVERTLTPDDLLIADAEGPVAVAGVMGGAGTEIEPATTDVLIECAAFEPRSIRRTSRRLALASESSYRFERGTDRRALPDALAWAAGWMASLGGGAVAGEPIDVGGPGLEPAPVRLRPARVARILGREFPPADVSGILEALGCGVRAADEGWDVVAPSWRSDLGREIDLIEEVARVAGFDAIPATTPAITAAVRRRGSWERHERLRQLLAARGLHEAVNHAFVAEASVTAFGTPAAEQVRLRNPLDEGRACLRASLLPGLLANARLAASHREPSAALFEIGKVFRQKPGGGRSPEETWRLGVVLAGARIEWLAGGATAFDVYDAQGVLAAVAAEAFRLPVTLRSDPAALPWLHPRAAFAVEVGPEAVGFAGEIHPRLADRLDVARGAVLLEIELRPEIFNPRPTQVRELPRHPAVRRDLAAVFEEKVLAGQVIETIREKGPEFLADVSVFDVYRGTPIPEGRKSMAFAVVYRAAGRTLTDAEVDAAHQLIVDGLVARYGVTIRK